MKLFLTFFLSFIFFSPILLANSVSTPKDDTQNTDNSKKIYKAFTADENGIKAILEELKEEKPEVYTKIKDRGENLISDIKTAKYISYGSIAAGTITLIAGFNKFISRSDNNSSDEDDKTSSQGMALIGTSVILFWGGGALASAFSPNEQDLNNFINHHNKLNPVDQLQRTEYKFWFDYDPKKDSTKLALNISF